MKRNLWLTTGRSVWGSLLVGCILAASPAASAAPQVFRASDARSVTEVDQTASLRADSLVVELETGEAFSAAGLSLHALAPSRLLVSQSSDLLTVAVISGRIEAMDGPHARAGQAIVLAFDGGVVRRMSFDAARLAASNSPGAASLISSDLDALIVRQNRLKWWGYYEETGINAAAPAAPGLEALRSAYLDPLPIIEQRRLAREARAGHAANAFVTALTAGDRDTVAALLDPAPFVAAVGPDDLADARLAAADRILSDTTLRAALGPAPQIALAEDGQSAAVSGVSSPWRLGLAEHDAVVFIASLEPLTP